MCVCTECDDEDDDDDDDDVDDDNDNCDGRDTGNDDFFFRSPAISLGEIFAYVTVFLI